VSSLGQPFIAGDTQGAGLWFTRRPLKLFDAARIERMHERTKTKGKSGANLARNSERTL